MNHPKNGLFLGGTKNSKMKFVSTKDVIVLFKYICIKCPHLVFESKQENKLANEYNKRLVISKKYCHLNENHFKNGLFLGGTKTRKMKDAF